MKKILFVITKSNWGGAQRYVYDLATALPKNEFEVNAAFGQDGMLAKKLRVAGITTFQIGAMQRDVSVSADIKSFFELLQLFGAEKPDIVHLNSSKAGGVGALAARLAGVKRIIFTAHGWPFWEQRNILSRSVIWLASWATMLLAHTTICISDYDTRVACRMPFVGRKTVRIYNGIDLHMQFGSGEKIRNAFPDGVSITGNIGELTKNKNQIALIEQAKNDPAMYVAIVGEGEDRAYLEEKIKEYNLVARVKLFGFMPAIEVLKGFDVFALPSLKEGLPYVLLEAKAADLPIIANRVGGVSEILDARDTHEFSLEQMVRKTIKVY
ncbi:glycosyltransferase [Candidatus Kaiserbacteria bacterium]|nr:glycosyltransferase [Candidatus Kaiserbacteria bacterium]